MLFNRIGTTRRGKMIEQTPLDQGNYVERNRA